MPRLLAVVVLYFPDKSVEQVVENFKNDVDHIIIVDNTQNNIGVAAALNQGLREAMDKGYDWLLTMDQDSTFAPGALAELKRVAYLSEEKIAIISPVHYTAKSAEKAHRSETTEVNITMTSGNLLRVNAAKTAGLFEEKLFIDSVDNEYCLRLRKNAFRIIRANRSILHHSLGSVKMTWFGFQTIAHPATRRYYITRNMLYVMFRYRWREPRFFLFGLKELVKSFSLIVLVEDDKLRKISAMFRGTTDFVLGRYVRNAR